MICGAFGAHALASILTPNDLSTWQTAVLYQFVHSLALLGIGVWTLHRSSKALSVAIWAFISGIVIFSGSLYLLVLTDTRWLGAVTPIGGTAFIIGWVALLIASWSTPKNDSSS